MFAILQYLCFRLWKPEQIFLFIGRTYQNFWRRFVAYEFSLEAHVELLLCTSTAEHKFRKQHAKVPRLLASLTNRVQRLPLCTKDQI